MISRFFPASGRRHGQGGRGRSRLFPKEGREEFHQVSHQPDHHRRNDRLHRRQVRRHEHVLEAQQVHRDHPVGCLIETGRIK